MLHTSHREATLRSSIRALAAVGALVCAAALALWAPAIAVAGVCTPSATQLCTQGGLIAVEASWGDPPQAAQAVAVGSQGGWFFFDDADAPEMYVEILDGCSVNDRFWVKLISLSDGALSLTARNVDSGEQAVYDQSAGTISSVFDTNALICPPPLAQRIIGGPEGGSAGIVKLLDGRFTARATWTLSGGGSGPGLPQALAARGAAFAFFSPSSVDAAIKIEDGDAGFFRVFYGWSTTVEFDLEVTDRCTGTQAVYSVPASSSPGGNVDESSFPLTPTCVLFYDGFESGDISGWD